MSIGVRVGRLDLVRLVEEAQNLEDFEEAIAAAARALPADAGSIIDFLDIPSGDAFDVAPEQAIGYFKAKGLKPTFSYAEMLDYQHDQAFTIAKMMNVDMLGQVRASLDSALASGQTFKDWADTVTPILQSGGWWGRKQVVDPLTGQEVVAQLGSPWRLETIFRTNMQQAYAAGAWQEIEAQKEIAPFLMYDAVDDFRTRPLHASWDRTVLPVTNAWWNSHYPPNGYNCFLPTTPISGAVVAASKASYAGEAVEIETERGARLSVTPNHPIATPRGWVAAGQLSEGDHVFSDSREIEIVGATRAPDVAGWAVADQECPASAEDLFNALATHGCRPTEVTALDFHGDAAGFDGEIDVVLVGDHQLVRDGQPASSKRGSEATLPGRDSDLTAEARARELAQLRVRLAATKRGEMGGLYLASPGVMAHVAPLRTLRIGLAAQNYPQAGEASGDGVTAYAEFASQLVDRGAGHVSPDKIVRVRRFPFRGHVFDFQTLSGALSAGGIVAHNCRCGVIQLSQEEVDALGLKVSRDPPDDGTYTWTNPRTGEKTEIERGIDPGFEHNAGKSWKWKLQELEQQKLQALQADMKVAAEKAAARQAKEAGQQAAATTEAAKEAQKALAAAQAQAALARAKALAEEKAKQWVAQQQLDLIAKGKEAAGAGAAFKIKALADLKKSPAWLELRPAEQLQQVLDTAADLKKKADLSKALSLYKTQILAGKTPSPAAVKAFKSLEQADADAFIAKIDAEKAAIEKVAAEAAAKAAAEAAAKAQAAAPVKATFVDTPAPDPATMVVIGRKTKGGTPGALYQDTATGQKWLVKFNGSADAVQNEVLASKLYNLAGVEAPDLHAITIDGQPALASRIIDGITEVPAKVLASTPSVTDGFAIDAWLANWDVAGLNFDNVVLVQGRALRIDVGGALRYRAVGGLKGSAFGRTVGEIDSLRDGTNAQARQVFGAMSTADVERSVERVLAIADADIRTVVARYGPPDADERQALADLMIARKRDLERRFPAAAERVRQRQGRAEQAPSQAAARVTADEQRMVEDSRANGFGFKTDSDQVEDQMVIVNTGTAANGGAFTRGWLKARPDTADRILRDIKATAGGSASINTTPAAEAILAAIKGINVRAAKGWELKDLERIDHAAASLAALRVEIAAAAKHLKPNELAMAENAVDDMRVWVDQLVAKRATMKIGGTGSPLSGRFDDQGAKRIFDYTIGGQAGDITWTRKPHFRYQVSKIDNGRVTLTTATNDVPEVSEAYDGVMADGTRITFVPNSTVNGLAMRGALQIDAAGAGAEATARVFAVMERIGLKATRSTQADRDALYLAAFARVKLARKPELLRQFSGISDNELKLAFLKAKTGVDIEASEGWRQREGTYQAFGHGRAKLLRPDLDTPEFQAFAKTSRLYHDPNYCKASLPIWDRLRPIIESGGHFASLQDRVRRGVVVKDDGSGASVGRDLQTGGGSYYFTRIVGSTKKAPGFYWKADLLKRMDAVTYDSDLFGRVDDATQASERMGQSVADFESMKGRGSNETIFKDSLTVFDLMDKIVLGSAAEVKKAIDWMRANGYQTWPDGRKLEDVFKS